MDSNTRDKERRLSADPQDPEARARLQRQERREAKPWRPRCTACGANMNLMELEGREDATRIAFTDTVTGEKCYDHVYRCPECYRYAEFAVPKKAIVVKAKAKEKVDRYGWQGRCNKSMIMGDRVLQCVAPVHPSGRCVFVLPLRTTDGLTRYNVYERPYSETPATYPTNIIASNLDVNAIEFDSATVESLANAIINLASDGVEFEFSMTGRSLAGEPNFSPQNMPATNPCVEVGICGYEECDDDAVPGHEFCGSCHDCGGEAPPHHSLCFECFDGQYNVTSPRICSRDHCNEIVHPNNTEGLCGYCAGYCMPAPEGGWESLVGDNPDINDARGCAPAPLRGCQHPPGTGPCPVCYE